MPKVVIAGADGPLPIGDIILTAWVAYDFLEIIYNSNKYFDESDDGQSSEEQSPLPEDGVDSDKHNDDGLGQVLDGAKPGRETKGHTKQWDKLGSMDDANDDFDSLNPQNVKDIPGGRTGKLPD